MNVERSLRMYRQGAMTGGELVPHLLALLDGENADRVLTSVPPEAADELWAYVACYDPATAYLSIGNVPHPTAAQVETARRWQNRRVGESTDRSG